MRTKLNGKMTLGGLAALALLAAGCIGTTSQDESSEAAALRAAVAADDSGNGKGKGTRKVYVCHIPPGNPANAHTIHVGSPALEAHLAHGDSLGACGPVDTTGTGGGGTGGGTDTTVTGGTGSGTGTGSGSSITPNDNT